MPNTEDKKKGLSDWIKNITSPLENLRKMQFKIPKIVNREVIDALRRYRDSAEQNLHELIKLKVITKYQLEIQKIDNQLMFFYALWAALVIFITQALIKIPFKEALYYRDINFVGSIVGIIIFLLSFTYTRYLLTKKEGLIDSLNNELDKIEKELIEDANHYQKRIDEEFKED